MQVLVTIFPVGVNVQPQVRISSQANFHDYHCL